MEQVITVYRTAAVRDALGTDARPGAIAVQGGTILAAGSVGEVEVLYDTQVIHLPRTLILPVLVNAHAHLDLTATGPQPYGGDFSRWLLSAAQSPHDDRQIDLSVRQGVAASRDGGVGYLGDIARRFEAVNARRRGHRLPGISYLECVGRGQFEEAAIARLVRQLDDLSALPAPSTESHGDPCVIDDNPVALGIEPHAPYSSGFGLYTAAARLAKDRHYRLCTHLAESPEEIHFVRDARGPLVDLLERLGKRDATVAPTGLHPIEWLEPVLSDAPWLLVHCNYVDPHHIEILARCGASVAYCPIASDYFGHHQPDRGVYHRYRQMLDANINVCLGTDSIICQRCDDPQPLGIGSQMRYLYRRDRTDPQTLLSMATVNGMRAMGLPPQLASLKPGAPARWVGVHIDPNDPTDPLVQALENNRSMTLLETPDGPISP